MVKRIVKLNESQLRNIIKSSINNILNESINEKYDATKHEEFLSSFRVLNDRYTTYASTVENIEKEFDDLYNNLIKTLDKYGLYIASYSDYEMTDFIEGKSYTGNVYFTIRKKGVSEEEYKKLSKEKQYAIFDEFEDLCDRLEDGMYLPQYKELTCKFTAYMSYIELEVTFSLKY